MAASATTKITDQLARAACAAMGMIAMTHVAKPVAVAFLSATAAMVLSLTLSSAGMAQFLQGCFSPVVTATAADVLRVFQRWVLGGLALTVAAELTSRVAPAKGRLRVAAAFAACMMSAGTMVVSLLIVCNLYSFSILAYLHTGALAQAAVVFGVAFCAGVTVSLPVCWYNAGVFDAAVNEGKGVPAAV